VKTNLTKEQLEKEDIGTLYKLSDLVWNVQKESFGKGGPDNMKEITLVEDVLNKKIKATGLSNAECWFKYCVVDGQVGSSPKLTLDEQKQEPITFNKNFDPDRAD